MINELLPALEEAQINALKALAGYKFMMFGYWAAIWIHLNRAGNFKRPNPFRNYVHLAQGELSIVYNLKAPYGKIK